MMSLEEQRVVLERLSTQMEFIKKDTERLANSLHEYKVDYKDTSKKVYRLESQIGGLAEAIIEAEKDVRQLKDLCNRKASNQTQDMATVREQIVNKSIQLEKEFDKKLDEIYKLVVGHATANEKRFQPLERMYVIGVWALGIFTVIITGIIGKLFNFI